MLRVDRDEHLNHVIFGQTVEDDRRHGELLVREVVDVGVQGEQAMLSVNRPENTFPFRAL